MKSQSRWMSDGDSLRDEPFARGDECLYCQSRRDFLKIGVLTAVGLSLPEFLRLRSVASAEPGKAKACILLWMGGGPSHLDTFDPKPEALTDVRGDFGAIKTKADGIRIVEHLPLTAAQMDKVALLRSITSPEGSHERASYYLQTSRMPIPTIEHPSYGAVVAKERGFTNGLPPFMSILGTLQGAGFLGGQYNAFPVGDPSGGNASARNLNQPEGVDPRRLQRRRNLLQSMDARLEAMADDPVLRDMKAYYEQAYDFMTSPAAHKAFRMEDEESALRDRYGRNPFGQGCLLARRLVETGVKFVSISLGGWDTHQNNFNALKGRLLPQLDAAYATLLSDLHQRGLLESTLVVWMGEFGRTPKVNKNAGRDHWPQAFTIAFAGGGTVGGQAFGATDATGAFPVGNPIKIEDVAATMYAALGIDWRKEYDSPIGRPIRIAEGQPITGVLG